MEEQLTALALGVGARVAETLAVSDRPLRWHELHTALEQDLNSRGTLTKTLRRLVDAGLVVRVGDAYALAYPRAVAQVLEQAATLGATVATARAQVAADRARKLATSERVVAAVEDQDAA